VAADAGAATTHARHHGNALTEVFVGHDIILSGRRGGQA
jgi:hypothetical protein